MAGGWVEGANSREIWEEEPPQECGAGCCKAVCKLCGVSNCLWSPPSDRAWCQNHWETSSEGPVHPRRTVSGPLGDFTALLLVPLAPLLAGGPVPHLPGQSFSRSTETLKDAGRKF